MPKKKKVKKAKPEVKKKKQKKKIVKPIVSQSKKAKKKKGERKDTSGIAHNLMAEALTGIPVPAHIKLRKQDIPFWGAIIDARAQWTNVDLAHAANLARCQADIEDNQRKLDKEGSVIENARGTPIMNPRFTILEQLSRRSASLSSKIQVHAAATIGEAKLNRGKNKAKQNAIDALNNMEETDDDLIAKPKPEAQPH